MILIKIKTGISGFEKNIFESAPLIDNFNIYQFLDKFFYTVKNAFNELCHDEKSSRMSVEQQN